MSRSGEDPLNLSTKPLLIVLSGFSGAGKDAVLQRMRALDLPLHYIRTVTTRPPRASETDAVDYHFTSEEAFQSMRQRHELLEWAKVYGNWYGVPRQPVKEALDCGQDVVVKVDVQGAATIKKLVPQAVFIFLTPPSIEELVVRLKGRRTESPEELALRTKMVEGELKRLPLFDYIVFNRQGEADRAVADISAIITAEKCRVTPREISL